MFKKILIANRGEIACRIIRTARAMGIACVAVYSEADRRAPFVAMADEAMAIGPAPAAQSYLSIEKIVAACQATGADAVHPGYGFLAENADFARAVAAAGLRFIGPNVAAIAAMGDKLAAKAIAQRAGVSVLPGALAAITDADEAIAMAERIGYPVIVKPAAGGGGKGMRLVRSPAEMAAQCSAARSETVTSFGDDRLFVEKFIEHPRHIEIQLLGDTFGTLIHLGERDCSIQRRHQKLIEEAPAPGIDVSLRARMRAQALALAKAVDYDSAGTVEMLLAPDDQFYFLEMNTRLQVEHGVTELVTGVDLVEQMIRSAAGERLSIVQADVRTSGAAIEARICAEDPAQAFSPSSGRIVTFQPPQEGCFGEITLRHDRGVVEGSEVSVHYDPMIGKLLIHAPERRAAIAALADALDQFVIEGIRHNILFLGAVMQDPRFLAGDLSTDFIAQTYPRGFVSRAAAPDACGILAAVAAAIDHVLRTRGAATDDQARSPEVARTILLGEDRIDVTLAPHDGGVLVRFAGETHVCRSDWHPGRKLWAGTINDQPFYVQVAPRLHRFVLKWRGICVEAEVLRPREADLAAFMPKRHGSESAKILRSPMPALVKAIRVRPGQAVREGEALCILEAMKMEMVLEARADGIVKEIFVAEETSVGVDVPILEFV